MVPEPIGSYPVQLILHSSQGHPSNFFRWSREWDPIFPAMYRGSGSHFNIIQPCLEAMKPAAFALGGSLVTHRGWGLIDLRESTSPNFALASIKELGIQYQPQIMSIKRPLLILH